MTRRRKKRFTELSTRSRALIIGGATAQIALQVAAMRDLWLRPDYLVRGPKGAWVAAGFVNFLGPIAYFMWGRQQATPVPSAPPKLRSEPASGADDGPPADADPASSSPDFAT
ncbi:PLD nuclease N-terminal domain-containing protein [Gordonia sp. VNQ95]|uniref:PLD nuclease N-terminal domain-containing protein n=1 Tax=Gordonia sp. VNQ95 TaxID=3156619 RepID=UPI0032B531CA